MKNACIHLKHKRECHMWLPLVIGFVVLDMDEAKVVVFMAPHHYFGMSLQTQCWRNFTALCLYLHNNSQGHNKLMTWSMDCCRQKCYVEGIFLYKFLFSLLYGKNIDRSMQVENILYLSSKQSGKLIFYFSQNMFSYATKWTFSKINQ